LNLSIREEGSALDMWEWEIVVKVTEERKLNGIGTSNLPNLSK